MTTHQNWLEVGSDAAAREQHNHENAFKAAFETIHEDAVDEVLGAVYENGVADIDAQALSAAYYAKANNEELGRLFRTLVLNFAEATTENKLN